MGGGGVEIAVFKILDGYENIDYYINLFFKIETGKRTRRRDFTLLKGQSWLDVITVNESNKLVADWAF